MLSNFRDVICDSTPNLPQGDNLNTAGLFFHALSCYEAIIDADGTDGPFGRAAQKIMWNILETMAHAFKPVPVSV